MKTTRLIKNGDVNPTIKEAMPHSFLEIAAKNE
jgi:hypothetical protein